MWLGFKYLLSGLKIDAEAAAMLNKFMILASHKVENVSSFKGTHLHRLVFSASGGGHAEVGRWRWACRGEQAELGMQSWVCRSGHAEVGMQRWADGGG